MKKFYLDQIGNDPKLLVRFREKTDDWKTLSREDSRETCDRLFRTKAPSELPPRRRPLQALGMLFENLLYQVTVVLVFGGALSILVIIIFTIVATIDDDQPVLHVYFSPSQQNGLTKETVDTSDDVQHVLDVHSSQNGLTEETNDLRAFTKSQPTIPAEPHASPRRSSGCDRGVPPPC